MKTFFTFWLILQKAASAVIKEFLKAASTSTAGNVIMNPQKIDTPAAFGNPYVCVLAAFWKLFSDCTSGFLDPFIQLNLRRPWALRKSA